ncbi:MazG-like family protein [Agrobacterium deltaense]
MNKSSGWLSRKRRHEAAYRRGYEDGQGGRLTLGDLQSAHIARQEEWCPDIKPDLSFRGNELGGECGEAQNVIKKLERERHGWRGSRDTVEHLGEELADVIHCAVLVAITAGIDIQKAVIDKFNDTSRKNELVTTLRLVTDVTGLSQWEGWDKSRDFWSETKHRDAVMYAMFRGPWSMEDAATLLGFIDRTWPKVTAKHEGDETAPSQLILQEDADCCIACDAPLVEGDLVYWDVSDTGYLHADCCGPERKSCVNEDGEPLKDGDPIPQPFPYRPDRTAGYIYTGGEKE